MSHETRNATPIARNSSEPAVSSDGNSCRRSSSAPNTTRKIPNHGSRLAAARARDLGPLPAVRADVAGLDHVARDGLVPPLGHRCLLSSGVSVALGRWSPAAATSSTNAASSRNQCSRSAPGHGRVGGRRRREDEQAGVAERARLDAERRPLAEGPAVRLLADEGEHCRAAARRPCARAARAESSKSAARRSPEPGVVRRAAFVMPIPSPRSSRCSAGASSRGVRPDAWSSRQKSLRGFAKCARRGRRRPTRVDAHEHEPEVRRRGRRGRRTAARPWRERTRAAPLTTRRPAEIMLQTGST